MYSFFFIGLLFIVINCELVWFINKRDKYWLDVYIIRENILRMKIIKKINKLNLLLFSLNCKWNEF